MASAASEQFLPALDRWWQRERVQACQTRAWRAIHRRLALYLGYELAG
jgi:hypothetical protein